MKQAPKKQKSLQENSFLTQLNPRNTKAKSKTELLQNQIQKQKPSFQQQKQQQFKAKPNPLPNKMITNYSAQIQDFYKVSQEIKFSIFITAQNLQWHVAYSYNDLQNLHDRIFIQLQKENYPDLDNELPQFPKIKQNLNPQQQLQTNENEVESINKLQIYLNKLIKKKNFRNTEALKQFLTKSELGLYMEGSCFVIKNQEALKKLMVWKKKSKREIRELTIYMPNMSLDDQGMDIITQIALQKIPELRRLTINLIKNKVTSTGIITLAKKGIHYLKKLKILSLNFQDNKIGNKGLNSIINDGIIEIKSLKELNLEFGYNQIGSEGFINLFKDLIKIPQILKLKVQLPGNAITKEGASEVGNNYISQLKSLFKLSLNLMDNKIGEQGAIDLCKNGLLKMTNLTKVDLLIDFGGSDKLFDLIEFTEQSINKRWRYMYILKFIQKQIQQKNHDLFRKEILTTEIVGDFLT